MDKVIDDAEIASYRLQCSCLDTGHALDITVRKWPDQVIEVEFAEHYLAGQASLWERLRQAWRLLRGLSVCEGEFLLRDEDRQAASILLSSTGSATLSQAQGSGTTGIAYFGAGDGFD